MVTLRFVLFFLFQKNKNKNDDDNYKENDNNSNNNEAAAEKKKKKNGGGEGGGDSGHDKNGSITVVLKVDNLHCEGCASKIVKRVRSFEGTFDYCFPFSSFSFFTELKWFPQI